MKTKSRGVNIYISAYLAVLVLALLALSFDDFSLETNLSAVISAVNNIGPGLGEVGPSGSYAGFSAVSKLVLSGCMLLGRLEFVPLLIFADARAWSRAN